METLTAILPDETATRALGARLAALLTAGDIICLSGPLGAGKTTLARGLIAAMTGEADAPSPTYALVEAYDAPDFPIYHFDLYRLEELADIFELGIEEAFDEGVSLIEWPEIIEKIIPENALVIKLEASGEGRRATIIPHGRWRAQTQTLKALRAALDTPLSAGISPDEEPTKRTK